MFLDETFLDTQAAEKRIWYYFREMGANDLQLIIVKTRFGIGTMLCSDLLQIQDIRVRRPIAFSIADFLSLH